MHYVYINHSEEDKWGVAALFFELQIIMYRHASQFLLGINTVNIRTLKKKVVSKKIIVKWSEY